MSRARKLVVFVSLVVLVAGVLAVPVASYDPKSPFVDVLQGYTFIGNIPAGLHISVQRYLTGLFTLLCAASFAFFAFER